MRGLPGNPSGDALTRLGQRHAGAGLHGTDTGLNGREHFGRFVESDAGIEFGQTVQNRAALTFAETRQFIEDLRHAHARKLAAQLGLSSDEQTASPLSPPCLPSRPVRDSFPSMSVLELKQEVSRMNKRERQELFAYLIRLKHETPEWKKATASRVTEMKKGRVVTAGELAARISAR